MTLNEKVIKEGGKDGKNGKLLLKNLFFIILTVGLAFLAYYLLPGGENNLSENARLLGGLFVAALVLWATEILPISVTSLLIIALGPVLGIFKNINEAAAGFTNPVIYFIIASFIIATAVQQSGLAERMALWLINRSGTDAKRIILVFMLGCAANAAIMSNVPTCALWASLVIPIINNMGIDKEKSNFAKAVMIGIPIASLTGGIGTPAGSSTNVLALSLLKDLNGTDISFVQWMAVGIPLALIMTVISWWVLVRIYPPEIETVGDATVFAEQKKNLGNWSSGEIKTIIWVSIMVVLWVLSSWIKELDITIIALVGSCIIFLPGINMVKWSDAKKSIGWDSVLIVGSVTTLGIASTQNGLSNWVVSNMLGGIGNMPMFWALMAICFFTVVLHLPIPVIPTIISAVVPAMIVLATGSGVNPAVYTLAVALASHCAFFLPLDAVPLVTYSKGYYKMFDMFVPGCIISVAWIVVNTVLLYLICPLIGLY